jgi:glycosyltransferase involved in cell wall biosynthesis
MRVAMPGLRSDFEADTGEGTQRYGYELYRHLREQGVDVQKMAYGGILQYASHMARDYYGDSDIIHMPNFRLFYPLRRGSAVTLVTAHDFQPLISPELDVGHDATVRNRLWFEFVKSSLRRTLRSDYLICNSTMTRQDAISLGYDKNRVFVSNHGIDDRFRRGKGAASGSRNTFRVGYLGGFRARKNVAFAIGAFKKVEGRGFELELWGKNAFEYDYLAGVARTDRRIRFMGFAPEKDLVRTYDSFDAFVFPSLYEGECLEVLEAQARRLPVIIYKKGRMPKEIRKYCLEAEDERHMAQMIARLKDNGYSEKAREKAARYARGFSWQRTARGTLEVYERIR